MKTHVKRLSRDERKARTRVQLIEAAARVFGRKGYRAATVDDVAQEAGFTKGAFYSNFDSKDDVFLALVEDRSHNWTIAAANAYTGDGPIIERLQHGGEVLTRMVEEEADWMLLSYELWSHSVRDPQLRKRVGDAYEDCREVIASLIRDVEREVGAEVPMPADYLAAMIIAMTEGFVLQRLADPERLPARLLADNLNLIFTGLMTSAGVAPPLASPAREPSKR